MFVISTMSTNKKPSYVTEEIETAQNSLTGLTNLNGTFMSATQRQERTQKLVI